MSGKTLLNLAPWVNKVGFDVDVCVCAWGGFEGILKSLSRVRYFYRFSGSSQCIAYVNFSGLGQNTGVNNNKEWLVWNIEIRKKTQTRSNLSYQLSGQSGVSAVVADFYLHILPKRIELYFT